MALCVYMPSVQTMSVLFLTLVQYCTLALVHLPMEQ